MPGYGFTASRPGSSRVLVTVTPRNASGPILARGEGIFPNAGPASRIEVALDRPIPPRSVVDVRLTRPADGQYILFLGAWLVESESHLGAGGAPP